MPMIVMLILLLFLTGTVMLDHCNARKSNQYCKLKERAREFSKLQRDAAEMRTANANANATAAAAAISHTGPDV